VDNASNHTFYRKAPSLLNIYHAKIKNHEIKGEKILVEKEVKQKEKLGTQKSWNNSDLKL
jgi:hypothetical protein